MSAWYILSALGLYQVAPVGGRFVIGSPLVDSAEIKVGEKTFRIIVHGNGAKNIYVRRATLNGKPYTKSYIDYLILSEGATLELWMSPKPSSFGRALSDRP